MTLPPSIPYLFLWGCLLLTPGGENSSSPPEEAPVERRLPRHHPRGWKGSGYGLAGKGQALCQGSVTEENEPRWIAFLTYS